MTVCKGNHVTSETLSLKQLAKMALKRGASSTRQQHHGADPFDQPDVAPELSSPEGPSRGMICRTYSDDTIQSTGSRRRYMRRGSRAPTMFVISKKDLEQCLGGTTDFDNDITDDNNIPHRQSDDPCDEVMEDLSCGTNDQYHARRQPQQQPQPRRLSLTTTLYKQIEALSIHNNESMNSSSSSRHMKLKLQRRYSTNSNIPPCQQAKKLPMSTKSFIPVVVTTPHIQQQLGDYENSHHDNSSLHDDSTSTSYHYS